MSCSLSLNKKVTKAMHRCFNF